MERTRGKLPVLCPSSKNLLTYTHPSGRRLENQEVLDFLRSQEVTHYLPGVRKLPSRLFLVVYPPRRREIEDFFQMQAPLGWTLQYVFHDREGMEFLKQLGVMHPGMGVPRVETFFLILPNRKLFRRYRSRGDALKATQEWPFRDEDYPDPSPGARTEAPGDRFENAV